MLQLVLQPTDCVSDFDEVGRAVYMKGTTRPRMLGIDAVLFGEDMFRGIPVLPDSTLKTEWGRGTAHQGLHPPALRVRVWDERDAL